MADSHNKFLQKQVIEDHVFYFHCLSHLCCGIETVDHQLKKRAKNGRL